jgi:type II secretory pathway pseudopilin PulG
MKRSALSHQQRLGGFSLLELLMVIGLIGLLAFVLLPGRQRAGLQEKARQAREDLHELHTAVEAVRMHSPAPDGVPVSHATLKPYLKKGSRLAEAPIDPFGNPYHNLIFGQKPRISTQTEEYLKNVLPAGFWEK